METFVKVVLYAAAGLVLLLLNVAYVHRLRAEWRKGPQTPVVPPLRLLGKPDAANAGPVMAQMIIAKVAHIDQQLKNAVALLHAESATHLRPSGDGQLTLNAAFPMSVERLDSVNQFDAKVSLGGVEVTGLVSWIQRALTADRVIDIAVHYGEKSAVASLSPTASGGDAMWVDIDGLNDSAIIEHVAYAVHKRLVDPQMKEWRDLTLAEYKVLVQLLIEAGHLNRRSAMATEDQYRDLSDRIVLLTATANLRWDPLNELSAQIAERANKLEAAETAYLQALAQAPPAARPRIEAKLNELKQKVVVKERAQAAAATAPPEDAATRALQPAVEFHRAAGTMTRELRVGVVGPPPGPLLDYEEAFPATATQLKVEPHMSAYMAGLSASIRAIAPAARVVYIWADAPGTTVSSSFASERILEAMNAAMNANVDVLLYTYVGGEAVRLIVPAVRNLADAGVVVVVAAGNDETDSLPFADTDLQSRVAVMSAVDRSGRPTRFTTKGPSSLWTLGQNLPIAARDGDVTVKSGTSYAAAIGAGVVARVLAQKPDLKPEEVLTILRTTSRPIEGGVPVVDVQRALSAL
jgi:Subtilase family